MDNNYIIKLLIREELANFFGEERIPNPEADEFVEKKKNFLGSHTYGEDLGDLHKMYVAYSYGEQHPLFVWVDKDEFKKLRPSEVRNLTESEDENKTYHHLFNDEVQHEEMSDEDVKNEKGTWFYNEKPYYVKDKKGKLKPNRWTYKHLKDLKPNERIQARDTSYLIKLIHDFKKMHLLGDNTHTDLEPGEK